VGGFSPRFIPAEDYELQMRLFRRYPVERVSDVVSVIRVNHPATTTTEDRKAKQMWKAIAEAAAREPGTLPRVLRATRGQPYWAGRCARVYLASAQRSAQGKRYEAAVHRLVQAAELGARHVASGHFWRGLRRSR
jgi:hypothetical protein